MRIYRKGLGMPDIVGHPWHKRKGRGLLESGPSVSISTMWELARKAKSQALFQIACVWSAAGWGQYFDF